MEKHTSFNICNNIVTLTEGEVKMSPFLSTMLQSEIGIDRDQDSNIILDVDESLFANYVSFLKGDDFRMDEEDEAFFDMMGHPNMMQYPLEFWKITLREKWVRENMYRLELYKDPYFDLVELPIREHLEYMGEYWNDAPTIIKPPKGMVIAGGAALWMATACSRGQQDPIDHSTTDEDDILNFTDIEITNHEIPPLARTGARSSTYTDIDMFFVCPKEEAEKILESEIEKMSEGYECGIGKNSITLDMKRQFILRLYKAPTEVVHGFDVDCCGILYDGEKLWATKRAAYAIQHRINYINPERASPSYYWRLSKYHTRGYDIGIPLLKEEDVDLASFKTQLADLFFTDGLAYVHQGVEADEADGEIERILNPTVPDSDIEDEDSDELELDELMEYLRIKDKYHRYLRNRDVDGQMAEFLGSLVPEINALVRERTAAFLEQMRGRSIPPMPNISTPIPLTPAELLRSDEYTSHNPIIDMIASHCSFPVPPEDMFRMTYHTGTYFGMNNKHPWGTVINILRGTYWSIDTSGQGRKYMPSKAIEKVRALIPKDPASIIILSKFLNLHTFYWRQSDYEPEMEVQKMRKEKCPAPEWMKQYRGKDTYNVMKPVISEIQWKEQDPMTQVTSTFQPEPISNIYEWLSSSPLYHTDA